MEASIGRSCDASDSDVAAPPSFTPTLVSVTSFRAEEDRPARRLIDWLLANGAVIGPLAVERSPYGRIVRATADIDEGTELARIPPHLYVTVSKAKASRIGARLAALPHEVTGRTYLAAFLLEARRDGGFWSPYVDILPREFPTHPVYFGPLELMVLDPRTSIGGCVKEVRKMNSAGYESAATVLTDEGFDRDDFDWAFCCVHTRAYGLKVGDQLEPSLVPFAELRNHVNRPTTVDRRRELIEQPGQRECVIFAGRSMARGDEATTSYLEEGNAVLMSVYGFCLEANEFDCAVLRVGESHFMMVKKYADPTVRAMFASVRLSTPLHAGGALPTDGDTPRGLDHELACLDQIKAGCETTLRRSMNCLDKDDMARSGLPAASLVATLHAAIESEKKVLWHFMLLTATARLVLDARGSDAPQVALLNHLDSDYAAVIQTLLSTHGEPHEG